ncbi:FkbM family methyltransferase [bacterium]|nr:FkbM family methyltransferase [bacterium]
MLRTDKTLFATLFNFKSILLRQGTRLKWDSKLFVVTDTSIPSLQYKVRHQRRCNSSYEYGFKERAESLARVYFLSRINFSAGDIFIDCGANVGDVKLWFELNEIDVEYIGFEPSPIEFSCLKTNVHPSVVHNIGLWNEKGELNFYVSSQGADSSLIEPKEYDEIITSQVLRLDEFVNSNVKCLKLEAEGAEPEILDGLGDKLSLIEYICADLGYERGVDCDSTFMPVTNFLLSKGFELIDVEHGRICAIYRNKHFLSKTPAKCRP